MPTSWLLYWLINMVNFGFQYQDLSGYEGWWREDAQRSAIMTALPQDVSTPPRAPTPVAEGLCCGAVLWACFVLRTAVDSSLQVAAKLVCVHLALLCFAFIAFPDALS